MLLARFYPIYPALTCALQLKCMQDNRVELRLGTPVSPPVPLSTIVELMGYIIPSEIDINRMLNSIKERNKRQATAGMSHNFAIVAKFYGI